MTSLSPDTTSNKRQGGPMTWHTNMVSDIVSLWLLTLLPAGAITVNWGMLATCAAFEAVVPDLDAAESIIKHFKVVGVQLFLLPAPVL